MNRKKEKLNHTSHLPHHTSNSGITLIALVITIVVMLILVAVTISMAVNGGIFNYAGKATGDTQNAIEQEGDIANGKVTVDGKVYNSIDDYLAGKEAVLSYEETQKDETTGVLKANAIYSSGEYTAVIPKGFKIIEGLNGTTTIKDGLVIQDAEGNEFVWIPVILEGETLEEKETAFEAIRKDGYYNGSLQTYVSGEEVTEPFVNGYTNEEKEYNEMRTSVIENKGFYIGRYEAGIEPTYMENGVEKTNNSRITRIANGTSKMVVKRDCYPYGCVGWGATMSNYTNEIINISNLNQGLGALALSKAMYANKDVGVTSTLCYGIQWDAMLKFMGKDTEKNSSTWGNYKNNAWTITRTTARWSSSTSPEWTLVDTTKSKSNSQSILLTTGASDKFQQKNIFDVAGNVFEWTNEASASNTRVLRGGEYNYYGGGVPVSSREDLNYPASYRGCFYSLISCQGNVGFRAALYIK